MVLHNYRNIKPREQRNIYYKVLAINTILNFISASNVFKGSKRENPNKYELKSREITKSTQQKGTVISE